MADKAGWDLLIFRQIDRANKTLSGDLEDATVESFQDYINRAYAAIQALQANVESQIDGDIDFSDIDSNDSRFKQKSVHDKLEELRERYQTILAVAEEEHMIHENLVDLEDPV